MGRWRTGRLPCGAAPADLAAHRRSNCFGLFMHCWVQPSLATGAPSSAGPTWTAAPPIGIGGSPPGDCSHGQAHGQSGAAIRTTTLALAAAAAAGTKPLTAVVHNNTQPLKVRNPSLALSPEAVPLQQGHRAATALTNRSARRDGPGWSAPAGAFRHAFAAAPPATSQTILATAPERSSAHR